MLEGAKSANQIKDIFIIYRKDDNYVLWNL